jgi:hypothetical protein
MLLVPAPVKIVAPVGTVQLYPVAPVVEAVHEYVCVDPLHTAVSGPVILVGATGIAYTVNDLAALV